MNLRVKWSFIQDHDIRKWCIICPLPSQKDQCKQSGPNNKSMKCKMVKTLNLFKLKKILQNYTSNRTINSTHLLSSIWTGHSSFSINIAISKAISAQSEFTFIFQLLGHLVLTAKKVAAQENLEKGYRLGKILQYTMIVEVTLSHINVWSRKDCKYMHVYWFDWIDKNSVLTKKKCFMFDMIESFSLLCNTAPLFHHLRWNNSWQIL